MRYSYSAKTPEGVLKHGQLKAASQQGALALLNDRGLEPQLISGGPEGTLATNLGAGLALINSRLRQAALVGLPLIALGTAAVAIALSVRPGGPIGALFLLLAAVTALCLPLAWLSRLLLLRQQVTAAHDQQNQVWSQHGPALEPTLGYRVLAAERKVEGELVRFRVRELRWDGKAWEQVGTCEPARIGYTGPSEFTGTDDVAAASAGWFDFCGVVAAINVSALKTEVAREEGEQLSAERAESAHDLDSILPPADEPVASS
jgi:hypothetical protein